MGYQRGGVEPALCGEPDAGETDSLWYIGASSGEIERRVDLGSDTSFLFLAVDDRHVYALDEDGLLSVVSIESGEIVASLELEAFAQGIVTAEGHVWVVELDEPRIIELG